MTHPTYAAAFHCIGPACEDHCCADWNIPVDKATYEQYLLFPPPLGNIVSQFVHPSPAGTPPALHAQIHMPSHGCCPFFTADKLCSIQATYGPKLLSATCSIYPRALNMVEGVLEGVLSVSCPEAARNILLDPDFMQQQANLLSGDFRTDNFFHVAGSGPNALHKPQQHFLAVRSLVVELVQDRSLPLWQRLLFIGSVCEQLDTITSPALDLGVPALLSQYRDPAFRQRLQTRFEAMPANPRLKLELVLKLTDERVRDKACSKRFHQTFWTFIEGIGSDAAAPGDDLQRLQYAGGNYYRPFIEQFPFILENYLLNYFFQSLFPFGRAGSDQFLPQSIFDEYIRMATRFAWVETLLTGIAGTYREAFAGEHIVHAIQSFTRAVEHDPAVLRSINETMTTRNLANLEGMAIMLRA